MNTNDLIDLHLKSFFVSLPAKIIAIDNKNFCEVQPLYIQRFINEEGQWAYENLPKISDVPLLALQSKDYFINIPIDVNDPVTLIFTNKDLYDYYQSEGTKGYISTISANNDLNNCYALPFNLNKPNAPAFNKDCISIEKKDGSTKLLVGKDNEVKMKASAVRMGTESGNVALAKANDTKDKLDGIVNFINTSIIPPLAGLGIVILPLVQVNTVSSNTAFVDD